MIIFGPTTIYLALAGFELTDRHASPEANSKSLIEQESRPNEPQKPTLTIKENVYSLLGISILAVPPLKTKVWIAQQ
jgi:hypothetical protein